MKQVLNYDKTIKRLKIKIDKQNAELERLNKSEKLLNIFLDLIAGIHWWKDKNGVYRGCNKAMVLELGLKTKEDIIGKTDYELPWADQADALIYNDQEVIKTGISQAKEELVAGKDGIVRTYMVAKAPLYDDAGNIMGTVGNSIDITSEKKETEKKLLEAQLQKEFHQKLILEQEKFVKIADQVAHDIRSPLSSLLMIVKSCSQIPEKYRIALREAATSIGDIANQLLARYKKENTDNAEEEGSRSLLVSAILLEILAEKKYQYQNSPVKFDIEVNGTAHFAFINIQPSSFRRAVSNLINNAVDTFEDKSVKIIIQLTADKEWVNISIIDNGKGMPNDIKEMILNQIAITSGKKEGHGIGLTQVHETLQHYQGNLAIESTIGKGTEIRLTFPRITAQSWIADEIRLNPNDIIVILDDDTSIHSAWNTQFAATLKIHVDLSIVHFHLANAALNFIKNLSVKEQDRIFLLTDFELLNQELNGLHVVAESCVQRSILVTSHYANKQVLQEAAKTHTKILPKQLASEISIRVDSLSAISQKNDKTVDVILVDDNKQFIDALKTCIFMDLLVDDYQDPQYFLNQINRYDKTTKIYLDSNFDNSNLKGMEISEKLYALGFTRLYLLTGEEIKPEKIPNYITVIRKDDLESIVSSLK